MYQGKKVSIVFPVYNEKENIYNAIIEFSSHSHVDEVIAVDNNSSDGSDVEIKRTNARYIKETRQGYGAALTRGMREATGDIIVTVEPDGTFLAKDLDKLLVYSRDFGAVIGTRTVRSPVWSGGDMGANMGFHMRMGNWMVAKLLEYLFNGPSFTDVGCTFKLIHKSDYDKLKDTLMVTGSHFSPHLMMRILQFKIPVIEVPVHYRARIGTSKITGKLSKTIRLALRMIRLIVEQRLKSVHDPIS